MGQISNRLIFINLSCLIKPSRFQIFRELVPYISWFPRITNFEECLIIYCSVYWNDFTIFKSRVLNVLNYIWEAIMDCWPWIYYEFVCLMTWEMLIFSSTPFQNKKVSEVAVVRTEPSISFFNANTSARVIAMYVFSKKM